MHTMRPQGNAPLSTRNRLNPDGFLGRRIAFSAATFTLTAALALSGTTVAFAATTETDAEPDELQIKIEESAAAYDEATAHVEELQDQIDENEAKIAEIEEKLPEYEARANEALASMYKMQSQSPNLVSLILQSQSLGEFITTVNYVSTVHDENAAEIQNLADLQEELESAQSELEADKEEAEAEQERASTALAEAQAAREEAQRAAEEKAAAEAAAAQEEAEKEASANESASTETVTPPSSDNADWSSDETTFIAQWAPRIDAYLAGSPLAGQGTTFARAAWTYGVDPRWSPAISNTESSKGRYCFKSHNAWGWGSSSWNSWEEAIDAHVRGLARGYGYTISVSAAKKYCPPNWQHWYNATLAEMNKI